MTPEIIRDKTMDWLDRFYGSPWLKRVCWALMAATALYFFPISILILSR